MSTPNIGDHVEITRDVPGASAGTRGTVTSTGFLGGLDITTESGAQITGVPADAVRCAPATSGGDLGCAVLVIALTTTAAAAAVTTGWGWA